MRQNLQFFSNFVSFEINNTSEQTVVMSDFELDL